MMLRAWQQLLTASKIGLQRQYRTPLLPAHMLGHQFVVLPSCNSYHGSIMHIQKASGPKAASKQVPGVLWSPPESRCRHLQACVAVRLASRHFPCAHTHAHAKQECLNVAAAFMQYMSPCNRHMHCMLRGTSCLNEAKHETVGT